MRKLLFVLLFISQLSYSQDMINHWIAEAAISLPTVVLNYAIAGDAYCNGEFSGEVTDDGGGTVTERGWVYAESTLPTISDTKIISGSGLGTFTNTTFSAFSASTTYYVRAYAINSQGSGYGTNQDTINTNNNFNVSAGDAFDITTSTAKSTLTITANGNTFSERYLAYREEGSSGPRTFIYNGAGSSNTTFNITGLDPNTSYEYISGVETNGCGGVFDSGTPFTTLSASPPTYDDGFKATGLSVDCPGGTSSPLDSDILVDAVGAFCFANNYSGNSYKTVVIVSFNGDYDGDGNTVFTTDASGSFSIENINPGDSSGKKLTFSDPDGYFCSEDQSCALYYYIIDTNDVSGPTKKVEWVVQNL